jgi:hypothetical protein
MTFIPSLELSRMLYEERIAPILETRFPTLPYAAATFGMCSEVLGLDDPVSMDHEWGPRIRILLIEGDEARCGASVMAALREALPGGTRHAVGRASWLRCGKRSRRRSRALP